MRHTCQRLCGGVRMNRADRALMPSVQGLQHVERLGSPDLADENAIRPVTKCGPQQVCDRDSGHRSLVRIRLSTALSSVLSIRFDSDVDLLVEMQDDRSLLDLGQAVTELMSL